MENIRIDNADFSANPNPELARKIYAFQQFLNLSKIEYNTIVVAPNNRQKSINFGRTLDGVTRWYCVCDIFDLEFVKRQRAGQYYETLGVPVEISQFIRYNDWLLWVTRDNQLITTPITEISFHDTNAEPNELNLFEYSIFEL